MIVSFSGAQGTGKSQTMKTVIQMLAEEASLWKYKPSCSSASLKQLYETENISADIPWWCLSTREQNRIQMLTMLNATSDLLEAAKQGGDWLFDRSVIDVMAYTNLKHSQGKLDKNILQLLDASYQRITTVLDLIVLFEPDPSYVIEARSQRNMTDQLEAAAAFKEVTGGLTNLFVVPTGSIEHKAATIVSKIKGM